LDIYAVVGANKPLQMVDLRVSVKDDGVILIRFESISGSPVVSGICIRRATKAPGTVFLFNVLELFCHWHRCYSAISCLFFVIFSNSSASEK